MVSAIILAAGNSKRLGLSTPKQFIEIQGKQILDYSISKFSSLKKIHQIILVVPDRYVKKIKKTYTKCTVISGGKSRKESSYNGLLECKENTKKVLIHDAARIFITRALINECIQNLDEYDAVSLAIPTTDTIAKYKNNKIIKMDNRSELISMQTPQGFNYKKIKEAHELYQKDATDDIQIMLEYGHECAFIKGREKNFKITSLLDLKKAELILKGKK